MHNVILKIFNFTKETIKFFQILTILGVLFTQLYWIQDLTGTQWQWMSFCVPVLKFFVTMGANINDGSIKLNDTVFQYKYLLAVLLYIILYYVGELLIMIVKMCEDGYLLCKRMQRKHEQNQVNIELKQQDIKEKLKLTKYRIYVAIEKCDNKYIFEEVNIEEQQNMMNKFLIERTGIEPEIYQNGFVYNFVNFNNFEKTISIFEKLLKADLPLNYYICAQAFGDDERFERELLDLLISVKIPNKIVINSYTVWRYDLFTPKKYNTNSIGTFRHDNQGFNVFALEQIK